MVIKIYALTGAKKFMGVYEMPKKLITVNEIQQLDARLNNILKGDKQIMLGRLKTLMFDVDHMFNIDTDATAKQFYMRVGEELSESLKGVS